MNSFNAFYGKELMVFDWDKAARIIAKEKPVFCNAGLRNDWEWTGGCIFRDNKIVEDSYTYLSSTWAVPELDIDGVLIPCFKMESETPGWSCDTKWPESARKILKGKV